jgi:hypothetical protein
MKEQTEKRLDSAQVYAIAIECARINDCKLCELSCGNCQYNVFNYGLKPAEASLIKANAYTDYNRNKKVQWEIDSVKIGHSIINLLVVVAVGALIVWGCDQCHTPTKTVTVTPPVIDRYNNGNYFDEPILQRFDATLPENFHLVVLKTMWQEKVKDIDNDGKVNCVDYSIRFRQLYGPGARIIVNQNPNEYYPSIMNHMFIQLPDGTYLEPQSKTTNFDVAEYWGVIYDPEYNKDETVKWWDDKYWLF